LGVGPATRLVEYVQLMRKSYRARFLLGRESDTEDVEGDVVELVDPAIPSSAAIAAVLPRFIGRILQRPPAYSALKVDGRRAYHLARAGQEVRLAPRTIDVYAMEVLDYNYPHLVLDIDCGSGTYVRSLGRDIAIELGTAAVMAELERIAIGPFRMNTAISLNALTPENIAAHLLSPQLAVVDMPSVLLSAEEILRIARGQSIERSDQPPDHGELVALDDSQRLIAILQRRRGSQFGPVRNFAAQ
jgi:tRNA pseudouridine55 synthase